MRKPTALKRAIFESGIAQKDIAERVGIDPGHMSRIANGLHTNDATREAISTALGRTVDELWPEQIPA